VRKSTDHARRAPHIPWITSRSDEPESTESILTSRLGHCLEAS
jgi:hypothetical protein